MGWSCFRLNVLVALIATLAVEPLDVWITTKAFGASRDWRQVFLPSDSPLAAGLVTCVSLAREIPVQIASSKRLMRAR